tara:strand:- start:1532 stop:1663 length:132 start_codon:yes stop_codon:yes gene_type:complete
MTTLLLELVTLEQKRVVEFTSQIKRKITQPKNFKNKVGKMKHY